MQRHAHKRPDRQLANLVLGWLFTAFTKSLNPFFGMTQDFTQTLHLRPPPQASGEISYSLEQIACSI